jgi:uncharacterized membrane protein
MALSLVSIVEYLHVAAAVVWIGGSVFMAFAVWPMLLSLPPREARARFDGMAKGAGPLMAISGNVVMIAGLLRGTWLGPIRSLAILTTSYGIAFLIALAIATALAVHGARSEKRSQRWLSGEGDSVSADVVREVHRDGYIILAAFAAILACMMIMRFGL